MIKVKNNQLTSDIWVGQTIEPSEEYTLQSIDLNNWRDNLKVNADILSGLIGVSDGNSYYTNVVSALNYLKGSIINSSIISQPDPAPFAIPAYRTKRMKTTSIVSCDPNTNVEIAFKLPSELYSQGGNLIVQNAEFGDYITAEVEDIDGIIPAPYRAATCEAWPIVAQYIVGQWIEVSGLYSNIILDTRPLIAKLSSGLYLCLHYYATNSGTARNIGVNYFMNKKL